MQSTVYTAAIWYAPKYQRQTAACAVLLYTQTHSPLMLKKKSFWSKRTWSGCILRCELILHGNNLASHSYFFSSSSYPQQWFGNRVCSQFVIQTHPAIKRTVEHALFPTLMISRCVSLGKLLTTAVSVVSLCVIPPLVNHVFPDCRDFFVLSYYKRHQPPCQRQDNDKSTPLRS